MSEIIVGLSGHIDHGKTSIIKSLTNEFSGILKEDLDRGMTVDLGIAFLNKKITLIDVPGHKDYLKNMLSGIQSVDVGLLVIAADDGIMPQTIDHFNILKLLNISELIILINKIDLVDEEMIELVKLEIIDLIKGSNYENAKILNISTIKNIGISDLKKTLENISKFNKKADGAFRMPIDRIFSVKGFGTVVTGTVISGNINIGDEISIEPISKVAKIRGINSHNITSKSVSKGQRAAINFQNIDKNDLKRGYQVVDKISYEGIKSIIAKIDILDDLDKPIKRNQRIRIHLGTAEVIGQIFLFDYQNLKGGEKTHVLINFEKPIVGTFNDRFIIRHYSPVFTLGAGTILLHSKNNNYFFNQNMKLSQISNIINEINNLNDEKFIEYIISKYNFNPITFNNLCNQLGYSKLQLDKFLKLNNNILEIKFLNKHWIVTKKQISLLKSKVHDSIKTFFKQNTYSSSINKEIIINDTNLNGNFVDYLLILLQNENIIEKKLDGWSLFKYKVVLSKNDDQNKIKLLNILKDEGMNTSSIKELIIKCNIKDEETLMRIIKICESEKLIIRLDKSMLFLNSNIELIKEKLSNFFKDNNSLSVPQFKEIFKISRKYAIPILEYLDKIKFTQRNGNIREIVK